MRKKANRAAYGSVAISELYNGAIEPPAFAGSLYRMLDAKFGDLGQSYVTLATSLTPLALSTNELDVSRNSVRSNVTPRVSSTSYVSPFGAKLAPTMPAKPKLRQALALFDYKKLQHGDLEFKAGDLIWVKSEADDNWWNGTVNGQTGDFPASYVQIQ